MPSGPPAHHLFGSDPAAIAGAQVRDDLLRRVWGFARPYRTMLVLFLVVLIAEALLAITPTLLIRRIVDGALADGDEHRLTVLVGLMVVAAVALAGLTLVERWLSARIGEGLIYDLRTRLFDHVQRMPIAFFLRTQTGALVSRMNNDVIGAQRAVTGTLGSVVSNVVVLVTTLTAMLLLEWRITIVALVLLPVFVIPAKRVGRRLQALTRQSFDLNASMNTTMTERFGVSGALLVKLFGRHRDEAAEFSDRAGRVRDIGIRTAMYSRTFLTALALVGALGTATIYFLGGRLVLSDTITLGTLIALGTFVTQIYSPLTALTNARVDVMTALVSFDRVFEVLDTPNPIEDRPDARELGRPEGRIELDGVWFRYPAASEVSLASLEADVDAPLPEDRSAPVLRGLDLDVAPGQTIALVGPSGAGKTTITQLLPRLYDPTLGAVRIDGHDLRELTQDSVRAAIGVVSQDPHLFHDTVAVNLRYARPDATDAELVEACRAARIHQVIAALPDGYDTIVGERGYRLSGGEKQRLAIARMLLKDPAIVILDEATSHLDSENESLVQQALARALDGRTSIVIAHRLSTVVDADQILVIDEGRIVQRGRHRELLAQPGLYAELYQTLIRAQSA